MSKIANKEPKKQVLKSPRIAKNTTKSKSVVELAMTRPNAAGIDVGATFHSVAVPVGRDEPRVRRFGTMTSDLRDLVAWLKKCNIDSVAMESTGVYWKSLFTVLEENEFEVYLVNPSHIKNVAGRKTDDDDAMWIQKLHSCDLLKSSYLPDDEQSALRTLVRYRSCLTRDSSKCILRMQKSLELMNIKFATIINDITGVTGTKFIEAILAGERNPQNFLPLVDYRIKATSDMIVKSLEGNWRQEHLFTLQSGYTLLKSHKAEILRCDKEIEARLMRYEAKVNDGELEPPIEEQTNIETENATKPFKPKKKNKNAAKINVRKFLKRIHKVDVMEIYGISDTCALQIFAETGADLSKWEDEKHFTSWLNLCPNNKITGGKVISSKLMRKKPNLASQAFRHAANAVRLSDNWIGYFFRRMKAKGGHKYAIVATANKIATIYYKMVTNKEEFKPLDLQEYEQKQTMGKIAMLEKKIEQLKKKIA